jgi:signal transduction histidine kinase
VEDVDLTEGPGVGVELNRFLDQIPQALSRLSVDLTVKWQSSAARDEFGDGQGTPCYKAHFGRDSVCPGCNIAEVIAKRTTQSWFLTQEKDGRKVYFEVIAAPVCDEDGKVIELIEILRDATMSFAVETHLISTSEQLETDVETRTREIDLLSKQTDQLQQNLKALREDQSALIQTEKMASVGRLAAGLTHEMHTPLGALMSNADMLRRCVGKLQQIVERTPDSPELDKHVTAAAKLLDLQRLASDRMKKILGSLRIFAHLDKAEVEEYDLHVGIDAALALLSHALRGRVEVERDYGDLPQVLCRPDAINQVFMNLLENASTAIEGEGRISVKTRLLAADRVELTFSDSGKGIKPENLERVLEPGFTTKPRGVGTGLGLAIVKSTIDDHGGKIELTSQPGQGTTFRIALPVRGMS